VFFHFGS